MTSSYTDLTWAYYPSISKQVTVTSKLDLYFQYFLGNEDVERRGGGMEGTRNEGEVD